MVCDVILWILICLMKGVEYCRQHSGMGSLCTSEYTQSYMQYLLLQFLERVTLVLLVGLFLLNGVLNNNYKMRKPMVVWKKHHSWQLHGIFFQSLITRNTILFGLFSGSMFFVWTGVFFYLYGWDFLNEALLYHLTRTDPRHNFSIYFYHIYLHHHQGFSNIQKLASFIPQLIVQLALIQFFRDLPLCMFLQTVSFVAFNKVMTAQYFVWFFCLLPLILPWTSMKLKWRGLSCMLVWMGSQLH